MRFCRPILTLLLLKSAFSVGAAAFDPKQPVSHPTTGRTITMGLEAEFDNDFGGEILNTKTRQVDTRRFPFLYEAATIETRLPEGHPRNTGNWEVNSLPVRTLEESLMQMEILKRAFLKKDRKSPADQSAASASASRGFHMHIHIPDEFFEGLSLAQKTELISGYVSRLSNYLTATRLAAGKAYLALNTLTVGRQAPFQTEDPGTMRVIYRPDDKITDIEIRGSMQDINLMRKVAEYVIQLATDPKTIPSYMRAMEALHLSDPRLTPTLVEYRRQQGLPELTPRQQSSINLMVQATKDGDLPLHGFEDFPLFSENDRQQIRIARENFIKRVNALVEQGRVDNSSEQRKKLQAEYRDLIRAWADVIDLPRLMESLIKLPPPDVRQQKEIDDYLIERANAHVTNPNSRKVPQAVYALRGMQDPRAISALDQALQLHGDSIFEQADEVLKTLPVETLLELARSQGPLTKYRGLPAILRAMRGVSHPEVLDVLEKSVNDYELQWNALVGLQGRDDPSSMKILNSLFTRRAIRWENEFVKALRARSDPESLLILKHYYKSPNEEIKIAAARAFNGRTDSESLHFIEMEIASALRTAGEQNVELKELVYSLKSRSEPTVPRLLETILQGKNASLQVAAVAAAIESPQPTAHSLAQRQMRHRNPEVRSEILHDLYLATDPDSLERLKQGMKDSNKHVRTAAFDALKLRTDPLSMDFLHFVIQKNQVPKGTLRQWLYYIQRPLSKYALERKAQFEARHYVRVQDSLNGRGCNLLDLLN